VTEATNMEGELEVARPRKDGYRFGAHWFVGVSLTLFALVPFMAPGRYTTAVLISILFFALFGAIYDFMVGYAGLNNFGFASFIAVGAYASALSQLYLGTSAWSGLLIGGLACSLVGAFTGLITLPLLGIYISFMTWFIGETIRLTISNARGVTKGMLGLVVQPLENVFGLDFSRGSDPISYFYVLLTLAVVCTLTMQVIVNSQLGLVWRSMKEDDLAAKTLGIRTGWARIINFTMASFFIGAVGAFYGNYLGVLAPTKSEFGVIRTVEVLTIAYVGGRGSLWGSFFAAALIVSLGEVFREFETWRPAVSGALLITVVIFAPKGLAGILDHIQPVFARLSERLTKMVSH
jgi:branched-chain amino acid transport system permease protein